MSKKDKRLKYEPIESGQDIDLSTTVTQAVILLDNAAKIALRSGNVEDLVKIADSWISLSNIFSSDEGDEVVDISDEQYGFCMPDMEVKDGAGDESISEAFDDVKLG